MHLVEVSVFCGSIASMSPTSYGLFAQTLILAPLFLPFLGAFFLRSLAGFHQQLYHLPQLKLFEIKF
jgi:hypothetical protein